MSNKIKNTSGFKAVIFPRDSRLVVYIGDAGEQKSKGGIILSERNIESEAYKQHTGILVDVIHANKEDEKKFTARLGDTLCFRPYAGINKLSEKDGKFYRILEGSDIHSIEQK